MFSELDSKRVSALVAGVICAVAVLNMPYGFYMLVRCVATAASVYLLFSARENLRDWQVPALILVALVFNPIWKVHLGKELWRLTDGVSAVLFFWVFVTLKSDD